MTSFARTFTSGLAMLGAALFSLSPASGQEGAPKPTGDGILKLVRLSQAIQDLNQLKGQLRDNESGIKNPFTLTMSDNVIRFVFTAPPKESINLDLKENSTTLTRVNANGKVEMPASLYGERVRGSAINYEDLSMRFLYWPNAKLMDESAKVLMQKCWLVRAQNPDNRGPYGWVDLWIDQKSGAMLKMEAWDRSAKKVKQFVVRKGQKYKDAYILKQMRVHSFDPSTGKEVGVTYMEIDDPN
ncbi:outer membrane lipoprotein-sorting protein [Roseimicrobium gellanilyticum]|uniref:Outer membrane lipoprotein-sorting protein n=1 Tax=Roseimicrobium gellanilyticum TaxID=748857 RepID=A0A366H8Z5_9BACT|nr:outer membrane lipoprotein-sorting protein [Roseimicrobium gellanilyticum]RBP38004.1 outer membrane lipoprotein-sorting protein [Roseimicrobium gellanilyticum]